jgi:hypothetical protein
MDQFRPQVECMAAPGCPELLVSSFILKEKLLNKEEIHC